MSKMEQAIEHYIKQNGIVFELRAINGDGEVILQETSEQSFDDVASLSGLLDERFDKLVINDAEDAVQLDADAIMEEGR